ncbi:protein trichome birefringence-like 3 [Punica granatum]|uniref:Uncharacterized protein n=2 Tax=Punica granatum TaxID=22663 RepID=A0A218X9W6_PUNGR|nr:protein trichome birefringence-like 3 [Punica granatum]OWM81747.1 hypothetical protein CDL15_Pgr007785 [Punica granatum]PKI43383.1 hypothetical protein CRG98_036140 [Punica granatum]
MKPFGGNLYCSFITVLICTVLFIALFYTESLSSLSSSSFIRILSCPKRIAASKLRHRTAKLNPSRPEMDERFEFDPEECNTVSSGKWVYNSSIRPLYTDTSCPYLDKQVTCIKNGRPDSGYLQWEWQPDDCFLPKFDPKRLLENLRGKRLMFVGDSIQRGQWRSLVCMVESVIPEDGKSMPKNRSHSIFSAKEYNATIEFYWAPFLVESNSDTYIVPDPTERILKVDSVSTHAPYWQDVDFLVFNSYIWWMDGHYIKSLWGSFANGEDGYEELERTAAYRISLRTWANWLDSSINPNRSRVFFTTISPTHMRSEDWNHIGGIKCYNETKPTKKLKRRMRWGGSNAGYGYRMTDVLSSVVSRMKINVTFINITEMSEYRVDAHTSVYGERSDELLTDEQRADPLQYADCIHWCLPGVPDTWNHILYAYLVGS